MLETIITEHAIKTINKSECHEEIKSKAFKILQQIGEIYLQYGREHLNIKAIPMLHAHIDDEGDLLIEWNKWDYRIGFCIDTIEEDSWFLVSKDELGGLNCMGKFNSFNQEKIISWLFNFVIQWIDEHE